MNGVLSAGATGTQGTRLCIASIPPMSSFMEPAVDLEDPGGPLNVPSFLAQERLFSFKRPNLGQGGEDKGVSGQTKSCSWGPVKGTRVGV